MKQRLKVIKPSCLEVALDLQLAQGIDAEDPIVCGIGHALVSSILAAPRSGHSLPFSTTITQYAEPS